MSDPSFEPTRFLYRLSIFLIVIMTLFSIADIFRQ